MKTVFVAAIVLLTITVRTVGFAAEIPVKASKVQKITTPSAWDLAFGAAVMNDYVWRGITQSDHRPSVAAYFEPRYNINTNLQLYAGIAAESIKFPNDASAEIDFYGGIRPTIGSFAFDIGFWYYYYPGGSCFSGGAFSDCPNALPNGNFAKASASFYEVYGKAAYTVGEWAFGANEYYAPNFLNTGAWGNFASATIKFTAPEKMALGPVGWYVSAEFGRQWLGTSDAFYAVPAFPAGIDYQDYNTWNIGLGLTWKVFTLDLRYSDTDLNKGDCSAFTSDPGASGVGDITSINPSGLGSRWCSATFIAKLSADLTYGSLK